MVDNAGSCRIYLAVTWAASSRMCYADSLSALRTMVGGAGATDE